MANDFTTRAESRHKRASTGFTASVWTLSGVVLVACGSVEDFLGLDDGGGRGGGNSAASGGALQVQKSPIQGARLYFDANGDGMLDAREKAAQDAQYPEGFITDATGRAHNIPDELHGLPFIADLSGAIDADTGEPFEADSYFRSIADANNEHILASPITDFIAEQMDAGESSADVVAALLGYSPVDLMPEQQQARDNLLADILDFDSYLSVGSGVEALAVYLSEEHDTNADANAQIAAVQNRVSALLIEDASDTLKIVNQDADEANTNIVDVDVAIGQYDKHITTITAVSHGGGITYRFIEADPNHAGNYRTAPRETYASFTINQQRGIISVADSVEALEEGTITLLVEVRNRQESEIVEVEITVAAAPHLHPGTNNGADITIGRIAENVIGAATGITGITTTASNPAWEIREATPTGFNFANKFDIVSGEGDTYNLVLKEGASLNFEEIANGVIDLRVRAVEERGEDDVRSNALEFTINVDDVEEGAAEFIIIGHAEAGVTLEAFHITQDPDGVDDAGYRYQWYNADGDIAGATRATYTLPAGTTALAGYGVRVSYTDKTGAVYSTDRHANPYKDKDAIDVAHSSIVFDDLAPFSGNIVEGSGVFDFGAGVSSTALSGSLARLGGSPLGFTYALVDDYAGTFTINPYTAAIAIADGAVFDYETQSTYNLIVKAEHESGVETYIRGTVNVIDADEGITESIIIGHAEAGTTWEVLHLEEDPNGVTAAGYRYQWYNADGDIAGATSTTYTLPTGTTDFTSYGVRISYTDGSGAVYSTARHADPDKDKDAIDIAHSGIVFEDLAPFSGNIVEGSGVFDFGFGVSSTALSGSLARLGGSPLGFTYALVDDYWGTFTITPYTASIAIANGAVFDYETRDTYNLIVKATHTDSGAEVYARGTIRVIDADEGITESIIIGHVEAGATLEVFHLEEDPNGVTAAGYRYQWYNADGDIAGATRATYEIPTGTTALDGYGVRISYTDGSGAVYSTNRHPDPDKDKDAIDIAHSGIVFTDINFFNGNVVEGTSVFVLGPGATSASLSGSLAEFKGSLNDITFSLIDDYAGTFTITSHTGAIIITDDAVFDYETRDTYNLIVKAEHASGAVAYARGTINVIDADEGITESIIIGHVEAGAMLEVFHLEEDPNGVTAAGYRYQWYNADGDIAGATRATYTIPTGTTDFASYGVRISYTDGSGVVYSTARHPDPDKDKDAIDIAHSGIVFTDINFFNGNVVEGTSVFVLGPGFTSAALSGSLAEFKGSLNDITFSLIDDYAGTFTITPYTGSITITDDAVFDYETRDTYNLIVKAEHVSGAVAYARGTIRVIDADEGVTESIIIGHVEAGATLEAFHLEEDPNGVTGAGYRYQWYNADGDIAGATRATYTIPVGTTALAGYGVRISYTDGSGAVYSASHHPDPDKDKDAIDIAHSGIVFTDINFFNGNIVEGSSVFELGPGFTSAALSGSLARFEGSLRDITFSLIDDYAGTFTITPYTGSITITDGAVFDYETRDTYNLIIKAEHVSGAEAYARGTINVIKTPASAPASAPAQIPDYDDPAAGIDPLPPIDPYAG